jgi:hypothetical protein
MTLESGLDQTLKPPAALALANHDDRWSLVLRIAASHQFTRAAQLRDILIYICQRALTDPAASIKEYEIGCNVLGRKPDFNPNEDNIVRVQISHLRKKLDEYFAEDGKDEPVQITVPKGAYVPRFEPKEHVVATPDNAPGVLPATEHREVHRGLLGRGRRVGVAIGLILLGMALGAAIALVSARHSAAKPAVDPVLLEAWRLLARPDANVLLSTATPLTLQMEPEGLQTLGSPAYPAPPEAYPWFRQHRPLAPAAKLSMTFTDNMLGVGTMNAVVTTVNTLRLLGSSYQILPERAATLAALHGRNAILYGLPFHSEAISRTMEKTPLIVDYEPSVGGFVIHDRISGRVFVPQRDANGEFSESYGLVTVLNTRDSDRGRLGMVIFSGIGSAATQGAAEFFASPRALRNLRGIFAREGVNGFPAAYQVVVKCTFGNLILLAYEYHSHRILQKE